MLTTVTIKVKIKVSIRALGYNKMYAPITPEIAPEAPKVGIRRLAVDVMLRICARSATMPQRK